MSATAGQYKLQGSLAMGLSATAGIHGADQKKVDPSFDGSKVCLPQDIVPKGDSRVTFKGKNGDVQFPYISWGAWSWGDPATWQWSDDELPALREAWQTAVDAGMTWIDTAQAYGSGASERITGDLVKGMPRDSYQIQTKWWVIPDNATNFLHPVEAPVKFLRQSLKDLGLDYVDCYLVHGHIHPQSIKSVAKGLAQCVDEGLTKTVGVANYSKEDMIQMADELEKYGVPMATNQCEFSLLRRYSETTGLLQACHDRGIHYQSYSSLAQGRLSGKYDEDFEPPKTHRFSSYPMKDLKPQLDLLKEIGEKRGKPVSAVALNYNISKGILPVVGIRNPEMARNNIAALGWRLSEDEMRKLDEVSLEGKATKLWQQG